MSRFVLLPLFELLTSDLLSDKEVSSLFNGLNKRIISLFGEIAYNLCVIASVPLTVDEKRCLRKFESALDLITIEKMAKTRRALLVKNPRLTRVLARIAISKQSAISKRCEEFDSENNTEEFDSEL